MFTFLARHKTLLDTQPKTLSAYHNVLQLSKMVKQAERGKFQIINKQSVMVWSFGLGRILKPLRPRLHEPGLALNPGQLVAL